MRYLAAWGCLALALPRPASGQEASATQPAASQPAESPGAERTRWRGLDEAWPERYALTISGGVSLGSYEAGLTWALVSFLKHAAALPRKARGRRPPELTAVTGASAGSINALLAALAWCDARPDTASANLFLNTWLEVGVDALLPSDAGGYAADDALLTRNAFEPSLDRVRERLRGDGFRPGCEVPVGIMVSRVEPKIIEVAQLRVPNQRFVVPLRLVIDPTGRPFFQGHPMDLDDPLVGNVLYLPETRGATKAADLGDARVETEDVLLLLAASSAFPLAFSARSLTYCSPEPGTGTGLADPVPAGLPPGAERGGLRTDPRCARVQNAQNALYPYADYRALLRTAEFVDGGVFDNVPLGVARALAESARPSPLPRVNYVYMDPDHRRRRPAPPAPVEASASQPAGRSRDLLTQLGFFAGTVATARNYELQSVLRFGNWNRRVDALVTSLPEVNRTRCAAVRAALPMLNDACRLSASALYPRVLELADALENQPMESPVLAVAVRALHRFLVGEYPRLGRLDGAQLLRLRGTVLGGLQRYYEARLAAIDAHAAGKDVLTRTRRRAIVQAQLRNLAGLRTDPLSERRIALSTRLSPLSASFLGNFGAFLERRFREVDYYIGVYDAIVGIAEDECEMDAASEYGRPRSRDAHVRCVEAVAKSVYGALGLAAVPEARVVIDRLAVIEDEIALAAGAKWAPADPRVGAVAEEVDFAWDTDTDGLLDNEDRCVAVAEDLDGFEDTDGCPDPDNDRDGVLDLADGCPDDPENPNGVEDDNGCPDHKPLADLNAALARPGAIGFTGRATLRPSSRPLLGDVADALRYGAGTSVTIRVVAPGLAQARDRAAVLKRWFEERNVGVDVEVAAATRESVGIAFISGEGLGEGIGLGTVGTIGHGAGTGSGQGFGRGHGASDDAAAPEGPVQVDGWPWVREAAGGGSPDPAALQEVRAIVDGLTAVRVPCEGNEKGPAVCVGDPDFDTFLTRLDGRVVATNPVSRSLLAADGRSIGALLLRVLPRQGELERETETRTGRPNPMTGVIGLTELGVRSQYDWEGVSTPGASVELLGDPSTVPADGRAGAGWHLLPYRLSLELGDPGLEVAWEPTLRGRHHALRLMLTPLAIHAPDPDDPQSAAPSWSIGAAVGPAYAFRIAALHPAIGFFGLGPTGRWAYAGPTLDEPFSLGGQAHLGFLWDKLRLSVEKMAWRGEVLPGDAGWTALVGLTDLPGLTYWLSR